MLTDVDWVIWLVYLQGILQSKVHKVYGIICVESTFTVIKESGYCRRWRTCQVGSIVALPLTDSNPISKMHVPRWVQRALNELQLDQRFFAFPLSEHGTNARYQYDPVRTHTFCVKIAEYSTALYMLHLINGHQLKYRLNWWVRNCVGEQYATEHQTSQALRCCTWGNTSNGALDRLSCCHS